ncbi:MAG TPA: aspartate aminotransferase family protein [Micromonosporaceae bacterium]|nr:aspartate aminotransferase family protein [Micromonosporaceae bacterium]
MLPLDTAGLQRDAREHLLFHFTDQSVYADREIPIYTRGEGCHLYDTRGRRYIDGLSGLFCTNLGHSYGAEVGAAAAAQLGELVFTPNWYVAHPAAIALATRLAELAPGDLNRTFFTSGGSDANEAAYKLARQWHAHNGEPGRHKVISRRVAYHGTSLGALSFTGLGGMRAPFAPAAVPTHFVSNTNAYRHPLGDDEDAFCAALLNELEEAILFELPETVAMMIAEPVQNSGGCFTPPRGYWPGVREICDRYGILLVSDEVICGFGRLGAWFGATRYGFQPDMITFAKGVTAGHAALGGVIVSDRIAAPFAAGELTFMHGLTFGAHPAGCAVALKVIEIIEREDVLGNVRRNEPLMRDMLESLREVPIVGDVRGAGHFWAIELVKDQATRETFDGAEADWLLRQVLSEELADAGLLCRLDDRGDPVLQLSPPLVADMELFAETVDIVRVALRNAAKLVAAGAGAVLTTAA